MVTGRAPRAGLPAAIRAACRRSLKARPEGIAWEAVPRSCDGVSDDLVTAGLGLAGLRADKLPAGATRRQALRWKDIRELLDLTCDGGFGRLYGAAADAIQVAGTEYRALLRCPGRVHASEAVVLVPDTFDATRPRLVIAPASGSRGATGSIGDIGIWALTRGCALALTDKGCGLGAQHLPSGRFLDIDGESAGRSSRAPTTFRLAGAASGSQGFALKHAHSGENAEAGWGDITLLTARYALHLLSGLVAPEAVCVVAAGVSNGGGAVLRAAELDRSGLIDAVVAVEPNIALIPGEPVPARIGGQACSLESRPLFDYATEANLLLPAVLAGLDVRDLPFGEALALHAGGLGRWQQLLQDETGLTHRTAGERLVRAGFSPKSLMMAPLMQLSVIWPAIAANYAFALGRYAPAEADAAGGVRFDCETGRDDCLETYARSGAGLAPGGGLVLAGGHGTGPEAGFAAARALRACHSGPQAASGRVRAGIAECLASGDPGQRPVIILHGRDDPLISPSQSSRAYAARAWRQFGLAGTLCYCEIDHAQHFDGFLSDPRLAAAFVPLAPYVEQALDLAFRAAETGEPLPPSQRVRTRPRGPGEPGPPRLQALHVPEVTGVPGIDRIILSGGIMDIPG